MSIFEPNIQIPNILLEQYANIGLNEQDLVVIIKLIQHQIHSREMPTFETISIGTTLNTNQVSNIVLKLIQKEFIKIDIIKNSDHIIETYTLEPLEAALLNESKQSTMDHMQTKEQLFSMLFEKFEAAFARPLTPIELETISFWFDHEHYSSDLIIAALNEAITHGKTSIKYIDKILLNWKKQNVVSVEDSKAISEQYKVTKKVSKKVPSMPFFDWINEEHPYDQ